MASAASRSDEPTTIRVGCMKSKTARPSRKNSGLDAKPIFLFGNCANFSFTNGITFVETVEGGTVDFVMITWNRSVSTSNTCSIAA